jgi:MFS superfamily sulfate permease-like transporter
MLAPVGVAYAVASGVGPIYGLYATVACLLAYAVFGPSRSLVLGPVSSLATIIFGVIALFPLAIRIVPLLGSYDGAHLPSRPRPRRGLRG